MKSSTSTHIKNALSLTALLLSLAALQCPLWRPAVQHITAKSGATVDIIDGRELEKALVFKKGTASLSAPSPGRLVIHGHAPGKTNLLIFYKDGRSTLFEVQVLPG